MKRFYGISAAQHQRLFTLNICAARKYIKRIGLFPGGDSMQRRRKKKMFCISIAMECARISSQSGMFASIRWHKDEA